jgi:hypothetical protein
MSAHGRMSRVFSVMACLLFLPVVLGCKEKKEETIDCECTPGMSETCTTTCGSEGLLACNLDCTWSDCMIPPEQCNGLDDDCDGEVDEAFQCTPGETEVYVTSCASEGTATCNVRCRMGECIAEETCNGVDDDCDGVSDNGFACVRGEAAGCTSACGSPGSGPCDSDCQLAGPSDCTPPPEACNGADDDCDGACDNGFECCQGLSGAECETPWGHPGIRSCDASCSWSECCSMEEICWDGHDDDCDGDVDETGPLMADVRVTSDASASGGASLQWTGSEFGVAWADSLDDGPGIYLARISASGSTIESLERVSDSGLCSHRDPSIQWTGSEFGVAWEDNRLSVWLIYFTRISSTGTKIDSDVQVSSSGQAEHPSLQWTGTEFAVSWIGGSYIYFARLSPSGSVIDSGAVLNDPTADYDTPVIAWSGSEFGMAWSDLWNLHWEIHFARLSSSGDMIGGDTMMTPSSSHAENPSIVWAGTMYGLAWEDTRDGGSGTYFTRISGSGEKIGGDVRVTSGFVWAKNPTIQWTGEDFALAWQDDGFGQDEIFFAIYSSTVTRLGSIVRVTDALGYSENPSIQWTGSGFGVVWEDDRADNEEIYFTRLGCLP